jgi:glycosyltransferase involved in cell wall biosynthesis
MKRELAVDNGMKVSLLTGGGDPTYALPLCAVLTSRGVHVDFIAGDAMANAEAVKVENCNYYNLRGDQNPHVAVSTKVLRILTYYYKLIKYSVMTDSKLFHILWPTKIWPSRFVYFDRTILNIVYKLLGKEVAYTAHNINEGERDKNDTVLNRITLRFMYKFIDHIFVHTEKMKLQLICSFHISDSKITVIPFGINNVLPKSGMTEIEAKRVLNVAGHYKTLLFFGQIAPYKGLDILISALNIFRSKRNDWRLIIAGNIKEGHNEHWRKIQSLIQQFKLDDNIIAKIEFIADRDVEQYFKAADVAMLPYRDIFQSGVLSLAYNFGLPVIASDVGAFREDIVKGETGFICQPESPEDLADKISQYFESELYKNLQVNRKKIMEYANERYSWHTVGEITHAVYNSLLKA